MAFTTTTGNPSTIQGTKEVDVLATVPQDSNFIVFAAEEADVINLQSTTTTLLNGTTVYGQDGNDSITSASGTQLIGGRAQGGEGADTLNFGTINSYKAYGGADNDTIDVSLAVASTIQGSKGNDNIGQTVAIALTTSALYGGEGNDTIDVGTVVGSTVQGSKGDDSIDLNGTVTGNSKISGGDDNDDIDILGNVGEITKGTTINGNKGADNITAVADVVLDEVTIFGGSGNDILALNNQQSTISGDKGADNLTAGTGTKVSVSGGEGEDTITSTTAATLTSSVNGGEGNDAITLGGAALSLQTAMQGRTDSTAATKTVGNTTGVNEVIANGDDIIFENGVDVVTGFAVTDLLGLGLSTTVANVSYYGDSAVAAGNTYINGVDGGQITWGDLSTAGQTFILGGTYTDATGTFDINGSAGQDDFLVIQGDGNAVTANTSMFVVKGLDLSADAALLFNATAIVDYIA